MGHCFHHRQISLRSQPERARQPGGPPLQPPGRASHGSPRRGRAAGAAPQGAPFRRSKPPPTARAAAEAIGAPRRSHSRGKLGRRSVVRLAHVGVVLGGSRSGGLARVGQGLALGKGGMPRPAGLRGGCWSLEPAAWASAGRCPGRHWGCFARTWQTTSARRSPRRWRAARVGRDWSLRRVGRLRGRLLGSDAGATHRRGNVACKGRRC